jgi:hypothetical protein
MASEEEALAILDQPELIEPEIEGNGTEAGPEAPATGDGLASDGEDNPDEGSYPTGSGFVSIAVGLAALLPLPNLSRRRC